jgi:L-cysteine/cystine lyase
MDVARIRAELPSATAQAYLNAGTFGPLPTAAHAAMADHLRSVHEAGRIGAEAFAAWGVLMADVRAAFATAVDGDADDMALTHSTTDGVNLVVWGLELGAGDEVVTTNAEHPGITAPLAELAHRRGVTVRVAEPTRAAIAAELTARTRLVAFSHVLWTTGEVLPLPELAADAHDHGALLLVDGAQSGGAIAVDAPASGADFYTLSGQKWLLGPSGTGALWVRRESLGALATAWPWYLSEDRGPGRDPRPWPGARRLDAGSSTLTALAGATAALRWRAEVAGWEAGFTRAAALARELRVLLGTVARVRLADVAVPSTLVAFQVEGAEAADVVKALGERGVIVRSIPGPELVRASVGFWNDADDLQRLADGLAAL